MQEELQHEIRRIEAENMVLRATIEENEARIRSLQMKLPDEPYPHIEFPALNPEDDTVKAMIRKPPVEGAIPAITYRDKDGVLRIQLCRTYAGEGWVYTPVDDGWIVISHESDYV